MNKKFKNRKTKKIELDKNFRPIEIDDPETLGEYSHMNFKPSDVNISN